MIENMSDKLRELRMSRKLSQAEVSRRLGITRAAVSSYESGKNIPPIDVIAKLVVMYETTSDYIFGLNTVVFDLNQFTPRLRLLIIKIVMNYYEYEHPPKEELHD